MKLVEAIDTFDTYLSKDSVEKAIKKYPNLTDRKEQLRLLNDAKNQNLDAINLLFWTYRKIIAKAFWQYYMGPDKKYYARRLKNREDYDFAAKAYELLAAGENIKTSPWKTFNPAKFSPKTDLIKKFGYYFFRYLQNEAFKLIRKNKLKGLSGNIPKDIDVSVSSYEDEQDNRKDVASPSDTESIDMKLTLDSFEDQLPVKYKKVFSLKRQGYSFEDIAKKLNISAVSVRNYLKAIKELWDDYV